MEEFLVNLEGPILLWIQEYIRCDFLDPIMIFFTKLGDGGTIWIIAALLMLCFKKTRKEGVMVGASLIGSLLFNNMLVKNLVGRTRPYELIDGLQILVEKPGEFSFPSGHTSSSFAAGVIIFLTCPRKIGVPALILAFLISISRLYVGVHFPTDVLGGMVMGTLIAVCIYEVYKKKFMKKQTN